MTSVRWAAIAAVVASVILAVIFSTRFGRDPGLVPSPLMGQPAPSPTLPLLDGSGDFDLASLRGRVVVVNFFASWCLPCRDEQDDLSAAAEAFAEREVTVVEIVYQDTAEAAISFLQETASSEEAIYLLDPGGRAAISYGVFGIPETFFIDAGGTVVGKAIGATDALVLGSSIDAVLRGEEPGQQVLGETFDSP
ncbi:MAG TPA: redoxin domain-containing protein [Acidimicrobiia bacterium]|nr:redoxin domain-containing protein [Acidimicrobiia bacterium]